MLIYHIIVRIIHSFYSISIIVILCKKKWMRKIVTFSCAENYYCFDVHFHNSRKWMIFWLWPFLCGSIILFSLMENIHFFLFFFYMSSFSIYMLMRIQQSKHHIHKCRTQEHISVGFYLYISNIVCMQHKLFSILHHGKWGLFGD